MYNVNALQLLLVCAVLLILLIVNSENAMGLCVRQVDFDADNCTGNTLKTFPLPSTCMSFANQIVKFTCNATSIVGSVGCTANCSSCSQVKTFQNGAASCNGFGKPSAGSSKKSYQYECVADSACVITNGSGSRYRLIGPSSVLIHATLAVLAATVFYR